jgi:phosphoglucomutase/phosphomannomutase
MDHEGPERFVYGTEESHGFLVGQYCRDKDGAVACMLMAQLAAESKARGRSVQQQLDDLYRRFGAHWELQLNLRMEGSDGMRRMQSLMNALRERPPESLGGLRVAFVRDFLNQVHKSLDGSSKPLAGPQDNLIMLETEQTGNFVAVRPSGTEPKVKFYMFAYEPVDPAAELLELKTALADRLSGFENDLRNYANRT